LEKNTVFNEHPVCNLIAAHNCNLLESVVDLTIYLDYLDLDELSWDPARQLDNVPVPAALGGEEGVLLQLTLEADLYLLVGFQFVEPLQNFDLLDNYSLVELGFDPGPDSFTLRGPGRTICISLENSIESSSASVTFAEDAGC